MFPKNYISFSRTKNTANVELQTSKRGRKPKITETDLQRITETMNVFAYYHRGNAYQDLQNYEQAISDYTQAIKLNPNYTDAYNNRGWTYYLLKNYSEAIKDFDKALEIDSNHQFAKKNRELCYKEINK